MNRIVFGLYILTLLSFVIFSYLFVDVNLIYFKSIYSGFVFEHRFITAAIYLGFIISLFIFYGLFLRGIKSKTISVKNIRLLIVITIFTLFLSYPAMFSFDVFNYILSAKVLFFYHENPYIIMPIEFTQDPLLKFTHAANKIALYGPGWILLTGIPHFIGMNNFVFTLLSFKLIILMFYLFTILIIWKMSRNLFSTAFFALNPLVVIEALVSSHNDIVMMFFALLSFFLLHKKKTFFAIISLFISIFIKYATAFLIPIFVFAAWKTLRQEKVYWQKIYFYSLISMLVVFLLSPLREEMYPWYAIWFMSFVSLLTENTKLVSISFVFSLGLMLRYIPFMASGTYSGITPIFRELVTFLPLPFLLLFFRLRKIWEKH